MAARDQTPTASSSASSSPSSEANISRHLVLVSSALRIRIADGLRDRGHDLSVAVTHIVNNLPVDGLRMTDLARRSGLSLQRAGQLVAQLEKDGYVRRVADREDGRARRVVYTRRGLRLLRDIDSLLAETNSLLAEVVGEARFGKLVSDLEKLDRALNSNLEGVRVVTS